MTVGELIAELSRINNLKLQVALAITSEDKDVYSCSDIEITPIENNDGTFFIELSAKKEEV